MAKFKCLQKCFHNGSMQPAGSIIEAKIAKKDIPKHLAPYDPKAEAAAEAAAAQEEADAKAEAEALAQQKKDAAAIAQANAVEGDPNNPVGAGLVQKSGGAGSDEFDNL